MTVLLASPVVLSCVALAAHFLRAGHLGLTALCLAFPGLLLLRRPWVPPLVSAGLLAGAGLWVAMALTIGMRRMVLGEPWSTNAGSSRGTSEFPAFVDAP